MHLFIYLFLFDNLHAQIKKVQLGLRKQETEIRLLITETYITTAYHCGIIYMENISVCHGISSHVAR